MMAFVYVIILFAIMFLLLSRGKTVEGLPGYFEDDAYGYIVEPMYNIYSASTGEFNWHEDQL